MTTATEKRANGRAQVEAVKGEVMTDEPKTVTWHDLELTLPENLPASFFFDMTDAELAEDEEAGGSFAIHAVRDLLGPEQWKAARKHAVSKRLTQEDFIDLVGLVYAKFGMGPGESTASSDS